MKLSNLHWNTMCGCGAEHPDQALPWVEIPEKGVFARKRSDDEYLIEKWEGATLIVSGEMNAKEFAGLIA
jgi:hypothetical protein